MLTHPMEHITDLAREERHEHIKGWRWPTCRSTQTPVVTSRKVANNKSIRYLLPDKKNVKTFHLKVSVHLIWIKMKPLLSPGSYFYAQVRIGIFFSQKFTGKFFICSCWISSPTFLSISSFRKKKYSLKVKWTAIKIHAQEITYYTRKKAI